MVSPPSPENYMSLLQLALNEDIGSGDLTGEAIFSENDRATYRITARESLVICGFTMVKQLITYYFDSVTIMIFHNDGKKVESGTILAEISGNTLDILKLERLMLNLLQRLSSIATEAKQYTEIIKETSCKLLDTRKTLPGWRALEKYAVAMGGGINHRIGLFDAFMIKDNHIAAAGSLEKAVEAVRAWQAVHRPEADSPIWEDPLLPGLNRYTLTVECDTAEQAKAAMALKVDRLLLDNMTPEEIKTIVLWRDKHAGYRPVLEASGGITKDNALQYAKTGIDYISSGAVTLAAATVDIGLDAVS